MNRQASIVNDLTHIEIPDEIKIEANRVFQSLTISTKRKKNRKRMVFFCVYEAYRNLNIVEEPRVIAGLVGLPPNELQKAFSVCSELQTGYSTGIQQKKAEDFIPLILKSLGINIDESEIRDILEQVTEKDPSLNEDFPQTVAAACISYFLEINGLKVPRADIANIIKRSDMTIQKICKKIVKAHNS
ncbi:transcription initiation factor TFIIB protein [Cedratvirus kamchatka]|uniref:Transcription initiation factor TFIIB protein n=1 Tax=Cedratvirus kamchatka TaxID=2716914 RepID=A0A6G8MYI9_9VIRU|nr:transcription initiation factor TFIIB protein [Cedratvirus kamchatka]WIL04431.1 transcription initiation factor TFIIB [Cedratvirus lena]WIL05022.1 transcription initiation factor TFIIB [Cedratvirus duvanny]